jgi:hypothetical protein
MVGAYLANGRPHVLDGSRLTVEFGIESDFAKKTVERKRELPVKALRTLTGHSLDIVYELREGELDAESSSSMDEEQLLERLKQEFGATEVFDDEES